MLTFNEILIWKRRTQRYKWEFLVISCCCCCYFNGSFAYSTKARPLETHPHIWIFLRNSNQSVWRFCAKPDAAGRSHSVHRPSSPEGWLLGTEICPHSFLLRESKENFLDDSPECVTHSNWLYPVVFLRQRKKICHSIVIPPSRGVVYPRRKDAASRQGHEAGAVGCQSRHPRWLRRGKQAGVPRGPGHYRAGGRGFWALQCLLFCRCHGKQIAACLLPSGCRYFFLVHQPMCQFLFWVFCCIFVLKKSFPWGDADKLTKKTHKLCRLLKSITLSLIQLVYSLTQCWEIVWVSSKPHVFSRQNND